MKVILNNHILSRQTDRHMHTTQAGKKADRQTGDQSFYFNKQTTTDFVMVWKGHTALLTEWMTFH